MELEKSTLAEKKGIKNKQHGISFLMRDVADMITTLNRAVHGEEFDERTAQWKSMG